MTKLINSAMCGLLLCLSACSPSEKEGAAKSQELDSSVEAIPTVTDDAAPSEIQTIEFETLDELQDPIYSELDDIDGDEQDIPEWQFYQQYSANLSLSQLSALSKLRENPKVLNYEGMVSDGYKDQKVCDGVFKNKNCQSLIVDINSDRIVFDGQEWAEGFTPTQIGQEVVKVRS